MLCNDVFCFFLLGVGTVLFEKRLGCFSKKPNEDYLKFIEAVQKLFVVFVDVAFEPPILQKVFTPQSKKDMIACLDVIHDVGEKEIEKKLKELKDLNKADLLNEESLKQFIPYLYYVKEMSIADIKVDILSIMMAAVDTVSLFALIFPSLLCFVLFTFYFNVSTYIMKYYELELSIC